MNRGTKIAKRMQMIVYTKMLQFILLIAIKMNENWNFFYLK